MSKRVKPLPNRKIGRRIAAARATHRMSQTKLGNAVGVTFQQIQKYENGSNRVSAVTLWDIARAVRRPLTWFFADFRKA